MDVTLGYLRESLSNHLENEVCQRISKKMLAKRYANEEEFVKDLDDNEMSFLNHVL
ncbi:sigma-G-dependent sporulation-specific acid-soluble spore protein CsgA, partial [Staphylococcus aureus]|uniref:sigma-G-dependent sporulation-specific acid-soluble spore protein CsgA n=1 Tax=Staphylococcus aureus TaxID=1280 RepID=UPI001E60D95C